MPILARARPRLEYYQAHRLSKVKTPCLVILISGKDGYGDTGSAGSKLWSTLIEMLCLKVQPFQQG